VARFHGPRCILKHKFFETADENSYPGWTWPPLYYY